MSRTSWGNKLKVSLKLLGITSVILIPAFGFWCYWEVKKLKNSTENGWFRSPTRFYSAPLRFRANQKTNAQYLSTFLKQAGLTERGLGESLSAREFTFLPEQNCAAQLGLDLEPNTVTCFLILMTEDQEFVLEVSQTKILKIYKLENRIPIEQGYVETLPVMFAQMSGDQHVLRSHVTLSQIPRYCLDAVLAIEDDRFLNHGGVSIRGIARAAIANFKTGRFSQGGSTLTQQLVKNKFLTNEKTITRKIKEAWISVLLELVLTKEQILEIYLNYIYWGQSGTYTINGVQEASKHYFDKDVHRLSLAECSLLAGAIKGPGIYGPGQKRSRLRQEEVLERMLNLNLINKNEVAKALNEEVQISLKKTSKKVQAPYYVNAVKNEFLETTKVGEFEGLSIYTEMDFFTQREMEIAVDEHLKSKSKGFEGSVLIADNQTNSVVALTSGLSQSLNFNSAIYGKRQIGSLAKPFVYLTALEQGISPLEELPNTSFTYKYDGQSWTPGNYSKGNSDMVFPMYLALSKSVNIPTVRLMHRFGYKKVYANLLKFGLPEFTPVTPSLALGSFEASPLEVLGAYVNLAVESQDVYTSRPKFIKKVRDAKGEIIFKRKTELISPDPMPKEKRMLLEMLKNTLTLGTAKRSQSLGLKGIYGGKTGTTNDHSDGWFAAVSPERSFVTWVGKAPYLTDQGYKITGSSAALPIWMNVISRLENAGQVSDVDWFIDENELESVDFIKYGERDFEGDVKTPFRRTTLPKVLVPNQN
jgi:penicillin-binding protein 1B